MAEAAPVIILLFLLIVVGWGLLLERIP